MSRKNATLITTSLAALLASAGSAHAALELVIKNTDTVPGIGGVAWAASSMFQPPSIDSTGRVGFRGTLLTGTGGVTSSNNATMWYGGPGGLGLVARTGEQAPGLPSGNNQLGFNSQNLPLSPNGNMWFGGTTTAPSGYIATGTFGGLTKVARNGETLPGASAALNLNPASTSSYTNINNTGQTAISGSMVGNISGMWVGNSSNLELAFLAGQTYTGLPSATTIKSVQTAYMINGSGAYYSGLIMNNTGGFTSNDNEYLVTRAFGGTGFNVLAHEGDAAPGAGGATYLRGLFNSILNNDDSVFFIGTGNFNNTGHAVYSTGLEGTGVTAANNAAVFYHDGASAQMFRRRGDAFGPISGATYAFNNTQAFNIRLNNNDELVMNASLTVGAGGVTSSNDSVLVRSTLGSAADTLLAREGSAVPITAGALWGTSFGTILQNNAGQIVFSTTLLDDPSNPNDNVTTANDLALYSWDPVLGLSLIAREGDVLSSIGINMTLTGSWLGMFTSANADGGANAFADNGWLSFRVSGTALPGFTDNTAIVRTQIIPAPGAAFGLLIGGATLLRRRRA